MNAPKVKRIPSLAEIAANPHLISTLDKPVAAALGAAFTGLGVSCAFRAAMARPTRRGKKGRP